MILRVCCLFLSLSCCFALAGQEVLANPSFEVFDGSAFGGWQQYGSTGSSAQAWHGSLAALANGQATGAVNESGFWQELGCAPGEQWRIGGFVLIPSAAPLSGETTARVKLEWFGPDGGFLGLETYPVASSASPLDQYLAFNQISAPAPAGTASLRLVLALLQGQSAPAASACFDQITCYSTASPTIDEAQWDDFPGGRTLQFANRTWRVKGPGFYGPGPNNFSNLPQSVWVDSQDRLHLTISQTGGAWYSTEVTLADALGYGDYIFTTQGPFGQLHPRAVLGIFLWQYLNAWDPGYSWWNPYNEIDVEYSRWGSPGNQIGQFVVQPWDWTGNIARFDAAIGAEQIASHAFNWQPDRVEFRAWYGGPDAESPANLIFQWDYFGPHIPRPEQPRAHLNLWYFGDPPDAGQEAVFTAFTFNAGSGSASSDQASPASLPELSQNWPNPFNPSTSISFSLPQTGQARLEIFDLRGRKVAVLADRPFQAGSHTQEWDAAGLPSGIYFYRLRFGGVSLCRKLLLAK